MVKNPGLCVAVQGWALCPFDAISLNINDKVWSTDQFYLMEKP